jgi:DNA damage-binding protein 1
MYNYIVSGNILFKLAYKSSAVFQSLRGNFTGPEDNNLIIGKLTRIEIYKDSEEGLQPVFETPIYGRISVMKFFRPKVIIIVKKRITNKICYSF